MSKTYAKYADGKIKMGVYETAAGRKVKMLYSDDKPIPKERLIQSIFPKEKKKNKPNVLSAARNLIASQITEFRKTVQLPTQCYLSGRTLENWKEIHVDHVYPFINLFSEWCECAGVSIENIITCGPPTKKTFKDEALSKSWVDYHREHAKLECTYKKANLKKGKSILV
jgi:hypothetical protein